MKLSYERYLELARAEAQNGGGELLPARWCAPRLTGQVAGCAKH